MPNIFLGLKRHLFLILSAIVFLLSVAFSAVTLAIFGFGSGVEETAVGNIFLGGTDESQYAPLLETKVAAWQENADFQIVFQGYSMKIDLGLLDFETDQTIAGILKNRNNPARFSMSSANLAVLETGLTTVFGATLTDHFDGETFLGELQTDARYLPIVKTYDLAGFLDTAISETVLDAEQITNLVPADADAIVFEVPEIIIDPDSRFSLLAKIAASGLTNEQMSIIASGLQALAQNTNLDAFVYEQYATLPPWAEPGKNVRILRVNDYDLSFRNDLPYAMVVSIARIDAVTLAFTLTGYPFITGYATTDTTITPIPFQTIYEENLALGDATPDIIVIDTPDATIYRLLIRAGVDGRVISYLRTTTRPGEVPVTAKLYDEQFPAVSAIYQENIVLKVGG